MTSNPDDAAAPATAPATPGAANRFYTGRPPVHLRDSEHDRDIDDHTAVITSVSEPCPSIVRITARISGAGTNPAWRSANVAIRLYLSERYGNHTRVYTVRDFLEDTGEVVVDIVQHEHDSPMMLFSRDAHVGMEFSLTGPRVHFTIPPREQDEPVALFADATAIPALVSIFDRTDGKLPGELYLVAGDRAAVNEITLPGDLRLTHIDPEDTGDPQPLYTCARALENPTSYVVWAAGERAEMASIRSYFRDEVGMDKSRVSVAGYWCIGVGNDEIDRARKKFYERKRAEGAKLEDFNDLDVGI
ncbi:SIP domain-containing protein [Corynebacterium sp. CCM 8835]|uniref:SIP domain-containing protein n=1 Tax=Corynebacterium antarcticum TaxID=2800405 RepID=A0ABS1FIS4_9CORY|nr:SIP domain-containing protein [Corynebacterium antarcticum]MCL0246539.1 SIP domain-containing protein [Corynebacterium antarcticum]MCX7541145.1 SIP domain-containing protein [Corynebacterium antarcticum]